MFPIYVFVLPNDDRFWTPPPQIEKPLSPWTMPAKSIALVVFATALAMSNHHTSTRNKIDWQIRPATFADAVAVQTLLAKSYSELLSADYPPDVLEDSLPLITTANRELLTCRTWYVAEHPVTRQIVGCGGWTPSSPLSSSNDKTSTQQQEPPHLRHFAVDPEFTRAGIARCIWHRSLRDMDAAGVPTACLDVFSTMTAVPFYQSCGFCQVKRVEIPLNHGKVMFPAMLMRRQEQEE